MKAQEITYDSRIPGWVVDVTNLTQEDYNMFSQGRPMCYRCSRFRPGDGAPGVSICDAFPSGVPKQILTNEFDHKFPWPYGDEKGKTLLFEDSGRYL